MNRAKASRGLRQIRRAGGVPLACWLAWAMPSGGEIVLSIPDPGAAAGTPGLEVPAPEGSGSATQFDVLEFLNGDRLQGTFFSVDTQGGVRWKHPSIRQVLDIDPAAIGSIKLNRPPSTNQPPGQTCLVKLTNADEILGELAAVDATNITLRTWYAGTLVIPRQMALTIAPGQGVTAALFEGPTSLDGWKRTRNARVRRTDNTARGWEYRNGAFYGIGNGSIGREFELPELASVEFDLAWNGYLNLGVAVYTDSLDNYGGDCYMLQLSSGSLYLQRMSKNGNSSNLGHSEASALAQKSRARIVMRCNKEKKNISLFIDDALVKQWTDRGDFPAGKGIAFFQQGQGVVRVNNVRIAAWDGKLDQEVSPKAKGNEDLVKLGNNDQISGSLKSIHDGKMSFGTEFATLEVPLDRIAQIELSAESRSTPERQANEVRAVFAKRGSITFQVQRWDDHQVTAQSPNFGQVKFLPDAFSRIDFNLNERRTDPDLLDLDSFGPILIDSIEN